jgi:hypothetical protein
MIKIFFNYLELGYDHTWFANMCDAFGHENDSIIKRELMGEWA